VRLAWPPLRFSAFVACFSATLLACPGLGSSLPGGCADSCETYLWPRLIVGVLGDEQAVTIQVDLASRHATLERGGCPTPLDTTRYACSYSIGTASFDAGARLYAYVVDGGDPVTVDVPLGKFNYCGTDITYIEYDTMKHAWSSARYISPCREIR
jgi:hypothetical protein